MDREWTPKRIRALRGELTQSVFAKMIGVRENTIWRWEAGYVKPQPLAILRLNDVEKELAARRKTRPFQKRGSARGGH